MEDINREKEMDRWLCCSGNSVNRHLLKYSVQVTLAVMVILFSMIQIARESGNTEIYFSLISGTMSYFLNSPSPHAPGDKTENI